MLTRCLVAIAACGVLVAGALSDAHARSLAAQLQGLPKTPTGGSQTSNQAVDVITPEIVELTARGVDFPATSTAPGFTYTYNPELNIFQRSSSSLGPALLERAETVGAGRFDLGVSYLFANVTQRDGTNFKGDSVPYLILSPLGTQVPHIKYNDFSLVANVWSVSGTYGITDQWDVNALIPLIWMSLDVLGTFPNFTGVTPSRMADNKFGIGDVLLRTKYRFWSDDPVKLAGAFVLRLPTGKRTDFQGLGSTTLEPALIASRLIRNNDLHANIGMEVNANDVDRTRARYGVGVTLQVLQQLAFLFDFIGSSGLSDSTTTVTSGNIGSASISKDAVNTQLQGTATIDSVDFVAQGAERKARIGILLPRNDSLDLALGVKVAIYGSMVGFASAIVPLNSDGVRADVIPVGGIEYSF